MAKTKELTKCQRFIALVTVVGLLIYSIANAFLVIFAYTKLSKNVNELADISVNWQQGTIQDIQIAANCATGYEAVFQDRYWPGVGNGCWCGGVSSSVLNNQNITCSPFCSNTCGSRELSVGCQSVAGRNSQRLDAWGSISSVNQQICIRRSAETFGNSGTLVAEDGSCPSNYTKCGTTADNVFCTQESNCPINEITVETGTSNCGGDTNCRVLDDGAATSNPRVIKFKRGDTNDARALSEFRLNEYGMCYQTSKDEITPGRRQFPLLSKKLSTCNNAGGSKWTITDTMTEDKVFQLNGLTSYISSLSPYTSTGMNNGYYETSRSGINYDWKMFSRGYITWSTSCRDKLEDILEKSKEVKSLKTAQLALLVIGLISTMILGIILSFMEIQNLRGVDLTCIAGEGEEERKKIKKIKQILGYGFKFLVIPFQVWAIILTNSTKALFIDVAERGCSDGDTDVMLAYFSTTLNATFRSNIISIAITVASLLFDLLLCACSKKDEEDNKGAYSARSPKNGDSSHLALNQSNFQPPSAQSSNNNFPMQNTPQPQPNNNGTTIVIELNQLPQNNNPNVGQPGPQMQYGQPQPQYIQTQLQPQAQYGQPQFQGQPQYVQPQQQFQGPQHGQPQQQFQGQPQYVQPQQQFQGQPQQQFQGQPQNGQPGFQ